MLKYNITYKFIISYIQLLLLLTFFYKIKYYKLVCLFCNLINFIVKSITFINIYKDVDYLNKLKLTQHKSDFNFKHKFPLILQKIVSVSRTSRATVKGRIRRFSIISIIGNKTGWIGIGKGRSSYFGKAVALSYKAAFKNIIYIPNNNNVYNYYKYNVKSKYLMLNNLMYHKKCSKIVQLIYDVSGNFINIKVNKNSLNINKFLDVVSKLACR